MLGVTRLVERVIPSDPRVILVPRGNLLPKPHRPVLMILVFPERGITRGVIRMPVRILATRHGVHVQDGVDTVCSTLSKFLGISLSKVQPDSFENEPNQSHGQDA